jgi:hypothetical protein
MNDMMGMLAMLSGNYGSEDEEFQNWLRQMSQAQTGNNKQTAMMMAEALNQNKAPTSVPRGMPNHMWPNRGRGPAFQTNPQGPVRNLIKTV